MVGYPGCIGEACPWSAGNIVCVEIDVVLMVGFREMWFLNCVRVASGVRCGRRGGRDRCGGGEGGESARAWHGGGGRWGDGAFIMCIYRMYQSRQPGKFYPQPWDSIGLTTEPLKTLYVLLPKGPALGVFRPLLGISPGGLIVWRLLTFTVGPGVFEQFTVRKGAAYSSSIGIMTLWNLVHLILLLRPLYHRLSCVSCSLDGSPLPWLSLTSWPSSPRLHLI